MFVATCVEISYNEEVNLVCDVRNRWLLDSGTTIHICTDVRMMEDKKQVSETVVVGNLTASWEWFGKVAIILCP